MPLQARQAAARSLGSSCWLAPPNLEPAELGHATRELARTLPKSSRNIAQYRQLEKVYSANLAPMLRCASICSQIGLKPVRVKFNKLGTQLTCVPNAASLAATFIGHPSSTLSLLFAPKC